MTAYYSNRPQLPSEMKGYGQNDGPVALSAYWAALPNSVKQQYGGKVGSLADIKRIREIEDQKKLSAAKNYVEPNTVLDDVESWVELPTEKQLEQKEYDKINARRFPNPCICQSECGKAGWCYVNESCEGYRSIADLFLYKRKSGTSEHFRS